MIHYASVHEQGGRKYQEDFLGVFCQNNFGVFALADGLGGHGLGDLASECVVRYAFEQYVPGCEASEYFQEVFLGGNERLLQIQDQRNDMRSAKTTLVCAVVEEGMLQAAYIGDSRLYYFRQGKIQFCTADHSVLQMLVQAGEIRPDEIRKHPDRNRLLRVLGERDRPIKYQEISPIPLTPGDQILLCTDGFWEYVLEEEMEKDLAKARNPDDWMSRMRRKVRRRGFWERQDNYSALGIWIG